MQLAGQTGAHRALDPLREGSHSLHSSDGPGVLEMQHNTQPTARRKMQAQDVELHFQTVDLTPSKWKKPKQTKTVGHPF